MVNDTRNYFSLSKFGQERNEKATIVNANFIAEYDNEILTTVNIDSLFNVYIGKFNVVINEDCNEMPTTKIMSNTETDDEQSEIECSKLEIEENNVNTFTINNSENQQKVSIWHRRLCHISNLRLIETAKYFPELNIKPNEDKCHSYIEYIDNQIFMRILTKPLKHYIVYTVI